MTLSPERLSAFRNGFLCLTHSSCTTPELNKPPPPRSPPRAGRLETCRLGLGRGSATRVPHSRPLAAPAQQAPGQGLHQPGAEPPTGMRAPLQSRSHTAHPMSLGPRCSSAAVTQGCQGPCPTPPLQVRKSCPLLTNACPPETHTPAPTPEGFCAQSHSHMPPACPHWAARTLQDPCGTHSCSPSS